MPIHTHHVLLVALCIAMVSCSLVVDPSSAINRCDPDPEYEGICLEGFVCSEDGDGVHRCLEETVIPPECTSDDDCRFEGSTRPFCLVDSCVACLESDDCRDEDGGVAEGGRYCYENTCVPGCDDSGCCCPGEEDHCIQNTCRSPKDEECNGLDDNFNGQEDEGFDQDEDGVSSCAHVDAIPDCDDNNDEVYPGGTEECDGLDNNCDGNVDEDNPCPDPENFVCDRGARQCVPTDNPCTGEGDCEGNEFCELETGLCHPDSVDFGDACIRDSQCSDGYCLSTGALGVPGQHCTSSCCNELDCPGGTFCADNGTGLKLCAPESWYGSTGLSCGSRSDCRACRDGECLLQCCSDDQCEEGCQVAAISNPASDDAFISFVCDLRSAGLGLYGESGCFEPNPTPFITPFCNSQAEWVIMVVEELPFLCICTAPCCSADQCDPDGTWPNARCILPPNGVALCSESKAFADLGDFEFGDPCVTWDECDSGVCHPDRYCTETCCPGSDCPHGYSCRPISTGGGYHQTVCVRDE